MFAPPRDRGKRAEVATQYVRATIAKPRRQPGKLDPLPSLLFGPLLLLVQIERRTTNRSEIEQIVVFEVLGSTRVTESHSGIGGVVDALDDHTCGCVDEPHGDRVVRTGRDRLFTKAEVPYEKGERPTRLRLKLRRRWRKKLRIVSSASLHLEGVEA